MFDFFGISAFNMAFVSQKEVRSVIAIFYLLVGLFATVSSQDADPCLGPIEILKNIDERNINTELGDYEQPICDNGKIDPDAWYRVSGRDDVRLAEHCKVEGFRCSTHFQLCLTSEHPTDYTELQTEIALEDYFLSVRIRRCLNDKSGFFYIYNLQEPSMCPAAYCTEMFNNTLVPSVPPSTTTPRPANTDLPPSKTTPKNNCHPQIKDPAKPGECLSPFPEIALGPYIMSSCFNEMCDLVCSFELSDQDTLQREVFVFGYIVDGIVMLNPDNLSEWPSFTTPTIPRYIYEEGNEIQCVVVAAWNFAPLRIFPLNFSPTYRISDLLSDNDYPDYVTDYSVNMVGIIVGVVVSIVVIGVIITISVCVHLKKKKNLSKRRFLPYILRRQIILPQPDTKIQKEMEAHDNNAETPPIYETVRDHVPRPEDQDIPMGTPPPAYCMFTDCTADNAVYTTIDMSLEKY